MKQSQSLMMIDFVSLLSDFVRLIVLQFAYTLCFHFYLLL